jgi:hypothetical protein
MARALCCASGQLLFRTWYHTSFYRLIFCSNSSCPLKHINGHDTYGRETDLQIVPEFIHFLLVADHFFNFVKRSDSEIAQTRLASTRSTSNSPLSERSRTLIPAPRITSTAPIRSLHRLVNSKADCTRVQKTRSEDVRPLLTFFFSPYVVVRAGKPFQCVSLRLERLSGR